MNALKNIFLNCFCTFPFMYNSGLQIIKKGLYYHILHIYILLILDEETTWVFKKGANGVTGGVQKGNYSHKHSFC